MGAARREHPDPVRPQPRPGARGDPVAARGRRRPPPPRARRHAAALRARDRDRRAARHPPHGDADRLRRGGDQPVPDVRIARRAGRPRPASRRPRPRDGGAADRQGDRQGAAEDVLEDGDLDVPVVLRSADLRGGRTRIGPHRPILHRHRLADRRRRHRRAREGGAGTPLPRLSAHRPRGAARRRRAAVAPRRRAAHLEPRHGRAAPARGAGGGRRRRPDLRRLRARRQRGLDAQGRVAWPAEAEDRGRDARSRSTRSSRRRRSSSASRPAR